MAKKPPTFAKPDSELPKSLLPKSPNGKLGPIVIPILDFWVTVCEFALKQTNEMRLNNKIFFIKNG